LNPLISDFMLLLNMNKESVRKIYLEHRKKLSPRDLDIKNNKIQHHLFKGIDFSRYRFVHTFLPIQKNNEINIWPILSHLKKNFNVTIIISKSDFKSFEMEHYLLNEKTVLENNNIGIPEPINGELYLNNTFDVILIPLVAFDLQGHRVGYGKGFYDRFLGKCSSDALKVGLSLFEPVIEIEGINEHDISLDFCATPQSFYSFKSPDIV
jgi:5-formyltetrahydrofolate cyclo-ligase